MRTTAIAIILMGLVSQVFGDLYMQSPPGSNDRNRERSNNRNNANRIFDSQNNAAGGYPWRGDPTARGRPDPLTYYVGSYLDITWTNQHSCGLNGNNHCEMLIQYGCDDEMPGIRDGYPTGAAQPQDPADTENLEYLKATFMYNNADGTGDIPLMDDITNGQIGALAGLTLSQSEKDAFYRGDHYDEGADAWWKDECLKLDSNGAFQTNSQLCMALRAGLEYGRHETYDWYKEFCWERSRNYGLYIADRNINGRDARYTRQNNNANRNGLECAEERDYFPWWNPSPWVDVAFLTSDIEYCQHMVEGSQNVAPTEYCLCDDLCKGHVANTYQKSPIKKDECLTYGGTWETRDSKCAQSFESGGLNKCEVGKAAYQRYLPDCLVHQLTVDNHLGNSLETMTNGDLMDVQQMENGENDGNVAPSFPHYVWQIPEEMEGKECVVRLRYNITVTDPGSETKFFLPKDYIGKENAEPGTFFTGADQNCKANEPGCVLTDDPYKSIDESEDYPKISIRFNTDQMSRTFQDRSYVFKVEERPNTYAKTRTIWNLNSRGRRGNIVQCYPATEYDFHPNPLRVRKGDLVHVQFHSSDFNAANNNNGEGWKFSDASNMIQISGIGENMPLALGASTLFPSLQDARKFAWLVDSMPSDYLASEFGTAYACGEYSRGTTNEQNSIQNCGKLNYRPHVFSSMIDTNSMGPALDGNPAGHYYYVSTRNNNFSNRSQKGRMIVSSETSTTMYIAVVGLGVLSVGGLTYAGLAFYASKNPAGAGAQYIDNFGRQPHTNRALRV